MQGRSGANQRLRHRKYERLTRRAQSSTARQLHEGRAATRHADCRRFSWGLVTVNLLASTGSPATHGFAQMLRQPIATLRLCQSRTHPHRHSAGGSFLRSSIRLSDVFLLRVASRFSAGWRPPLMTAPEPQAFARAGLTLDEQRQGLAMLGVHRSPMLWRGAHCRNLFPNAAAPAPGASRRRPHQGTRCAAPAE